TSALFVDLQVLHPFAMIAFLVLTCTSDQSRNYRYGAALGACTAFDNTITVEGAATAQAIAHLAETHALDIPVCRAVADLVAGRIDVHAATARLMGRPLKEE
ncbi:MAG: NAD(P)H-dependent glycerol-3-phosphate dehydrogenase, partial [Planctomycetota bacterium]